MKYVIYTPNLPYYLHIIKDRISFISCVNVMKLYKIINYNIKKISLSSKTHLRLMELGHTNMNDRIGVKYEN